MLTLVTLLLYPRVPKMVGGKGYIAACPGERVSIEVDYRVRSLLRFSPPTTARFDDGSVAIAIVRALQPKRMSKRGSLQLEVIMPSATGCYHLSELEVRSPGEWVSTIPVDILLDVQESPPGYLTLIHREATVLAEENLVQQILCRNTSSVEIEIVATRTNASHYLDSSITVGPGKEVGIPVDLAADAGNTWVRPWVLFKTAAGEELQIPGINFYVRSTR